MTETLNAHSHTAPTTADGMSTATELGPAPLFSSLLERVVTETYLWSFLVVALVLNAFLLFSIIRRPDFFTPFYATLVLLSIDDVLQSLFFVPEILSAIHHDGQPLSRTGCTITRAARVSFLSYQSYGVALLSVERTLFFWRPMLYQRYVTVTRLMLVHLVAYIISFTYAAYFLSQSNDKLSVPLLLCYSTVPYYDLVNVLAFSFPNILANGICITLLVRLLLKHKRSIADQQAVVGRSHRNADRVDEAAEPSGGPSTHLDVVNRAGSAVEEAWPTADQPVGAVTGRGSPFPIGDRETNHVPGTGIWHVQIEGPCHTVGAPQAEALKRQTPQGVAIATVPMGQVVSNPSQKSTAAAADTVSTSITLWTAIKLLLCTTASFWVTTLPAVITVFGVRSSGLANDVVESGLAGPAVTIPYRWSIQFIVVSCYINPIIHLYYNRPLRVSLCQAMPCLARICPRSASSSKSW